MAEGLTIHQSLKKHPSSGNNADLRKNKNSKLFRKLWLTITSKVHNSAGFDFNDLRVLDSRTKLENRKTSDFNRK